MNKREIDSYKYWFLSLMLVVSLGIILVGVFRLAIIEHDVYIELARENKVLETKIPAARGNIVDRKGRIVAKSVYQYFSQEGDKKVFNGSGDFDGYKFEGKNLAYELKRQYPYQESLAFVSGYVGRINEEEIKEKRCNQSMGVDEMVGRGGVEENFDCNLRGINGKRVIEINAKGEYVREMGRQEPEMGENIELSIDAYWQQKAYELVKGKKAVVIVSEPKTGKILVATSGLAFDPNWFSYQKDNQTIKGYLKDTENNPLLNRISGARFHPGSVFKLAVAMAGLQEGVIDANSKFEDTGVIKVGDYSYNNWLWTKKREIDGMVDVVTGLKRSNDIFFYRLGEKLGVDRIKKWADKMGANEKTGIELPNELAGIIPNEKWKIENRNEKWFLGNTYHMSIGQGDVSMTPLEVNMMTNVVANGGKKCDMSVLKNKKINCEDLQIKKENLNLIIEGMKRACKPGGTAWPLFNFKTDFACKTGTAEVGDGSKDTHAWLTAFAPADNPQISITVLVERGGEGSDVAAPIVGDFLKEWFGEPDTLVPRYKIE